MGYAQATKGLNGQALGAETLAVTVPQGWIGMMSEGGTLKTTGWHHRGGWDGGDSTTTSHLSWWHGHQRDVRYGDSSRQVGKRRQ